MQVAEAGSDKLVRLLVACNFQAGVFVGELFEGGGYFLLVASRGGFEGEGEHRLRSGGHMECACDAAGVDEVADFELIDFCECYDVAGDTGVDFAVVSSL